MTNKVNGTGKNYFTLFSLLPFILITFGLAWGIIFLYILLPNQMSAKFGTLSGSHPLFYLAVYAPAIAAFTIVMYKMGLSGLRCFLSRLLLWRSPLPWYIFLALGIPLIFYVGSAWKGNLFADPFSFDSLSSFFIALLLFAIKGPLEEFGWRGFVLPLLQKKLAPFWAALLLGLVWGFWHLPAFLLSGTQQSAWSFGPFFLGTIALSIIITALFNDSRGSILLAAIFHFQCINPLWPDAQPYDTYIFMTVAIIIVIMNRKKMFNKKFAVTEIVPNRPTT